MALAKNRKDKEVLSEREELVLFAICAILISGIFVSKAITTFSTICLILFSLRYWTWTKSISFFRDRTMMPFLLVFLTVFLSGGHSENIETWQTALRVKLPFLILPFAIYLIPLIKSVFVVRLHLWLLFTCTIIGVLVSFNALAHYTEMLDLLSRGQPIPTPIEHVKYSMFNAYGAISGIILYSEGELADRKHQRILGGSTILLIILMHLFAVRTGLVILYFSVLVYFGLRLIRKGSIQMFIVLLICILSVPTIAYYTVPSFQQKIGYMKYDWAMYQEGDGANYSDSERIMSYQAGWEVWKSNPVLGAGYGDVRDEVHLYYDSKYNRNDFFKLPHSQFLLTMSGSGILGLFIFLSGFYTPLFSVKTKGIATILVGYLYFNYSLSFIVENSLERSISVTFFLFFALFLLRTKRALPH